MLRQKYIVSGMTCTACQANIERVVKKLDGVISVSVSLIASSMDACIDETKISAEEISNAVKKIGYAAKLISSEFVADKEFDDSEKMQKIENNIEKIAKNSQNSKESAKNDGSSEKTGGIKSKFDEIQKAQKEECRLLRNRVIASLIILVPLMYFSMATMMGAPNLPFFDGMENATTFALFLLVLTSIVLMINRKLIVSGFKALVHFVPNMDSLVAIGAMASYIYGVVVCFVLAYGAGHGDMMLIHKYMHSLYFESTATILTLVSLGKFFETRSRLKTSNALEKLVNLAPKTAKVMRDGKEIEIKTDEIKVGDVVVIRTGDIIPCDGVIISGDGLLDQSAITGESMPVHLSAGGEVVSASICTNGSFMFKAEKVGEDTTLSKVISLVDSASSSKAPIARIADKVSGYFVPVVIGLSIITFLIWLIVSRDVGFALTFAVAVLVISCPCALGLATPVAIMVAMGKSASLGILIKSAASLEILHKVKTIVFDKTGTLTEGKPSVTDIEILKDGITEGEFLAKLASLENLSNHPLAAAISERAESENLELMEVTKFEEVSGRGVVGKIGKKTYLAGNFEFAKERGLVDEKHEKLLKQKLEEFSSNGKTSVIVYEDKEPLGIVAIADSLRAESKYIISALKKLGIKVVMLTGDNVGAANAIAKQLGELEVIANVLPSGKSDKINELKVRGDIVAMVGDGINDSPALAASDVGIAMGTGTDIAAETSDVVLTSGSIVGLIRAIELSKATIRNIKINLFWAFFYNILAIPLACGVFYPFFGWQLSPMIASLAMSFSSVFVVVNALTLNLFKSKIDVDDFDKKSQISQNKIKKSIKNKENKEEIMQKTVYISGMSCAHCKAHVENALMKVNGVKSAEVNLDGKFAIVEMRASVTEVSLVAAIEEAGYKVTDIK